ncbi:E3 ubiquitin-protein ligase TRIM7 [Pogona vitticeps]
MAKSVSIVDLKEDALCPICRQLLTDPVLMECGHNFCRLCISDYYVAWKEQSRLLKCPVCGAPIQEGRLRPNQQLASIVDKLKQMPSLEEEKDLFCPKHKEKLNLFCENDEELLCVICERSPEHKSHKVVLAEEAVKGYKDKLYRRLRALKEKRSKTEMSPADAEKETLDLLKRLQTEKEKAVADFKKLHAFLEEQENHLLDQIKQLQKEIAKKRRSHLTKLVEEVASLKNIIQEIEESCEQPAVEFLVDYKTNLEKCDKAAEDSDSFPLELRWRVCDIVDINLFLENIAEQYEETLVSGLPIQKAEVTFDQTTAHPQLILSEDRKTAHMGEFYRHLTKNPERFDEWPFVLGREGFASGRHYWEVTVGSEDAWGVGVAKKSVKRHGDVDFSPEEGFWAVGKWEGNYTAYNPPYFTLLTLHGELKRIRVSLNVDGGWVTFFDADTATPLFAYSVGTFSGETLFPFFYLFGKARLALDP